MSPDFDKKRYSLACIELYRKSQVKLSWVNMPNRVHGGDSTFVNMYRSNYCLKQILEACLIVLHDRLDPYSGAKQIEK